MFRALILIVSGLAFACGNVCEEAADKLNKCAQASDRVPGPPQLDISNVSCKDEVALQCEAGATTIVNLETWAEGYVDCDPDPLTCLCPNQPFVCPDVYP